VTEEAFMFYVYILRSISSGKYYIGQSENPERRLDYHNTIEKGFTSRYRPWELVWKKGYETRTEALKAETMVKNRKDRMFVERVIRGEVNF
jgi:putative endonuclease